MKEKILNHKIIVIVVCCVLVIGICAGTYFLTKGSDDTVSYESGVKKGDNKLIYNDEVTITKNDIYKYFLENTGDNEVLLLAINYICDQEITDQDAINAEIEELKTSYTEYAGTDLDTYAKQSGYADEADLVANVLTPSAKQRLLLEKYIDEKYDDLLKEYKVKYLKTITCDTESQAIQIIDQSTSAEAFDALMNENGGSDAGLVTKSSTSLDEKVIDNLSKFKKDGIYSKAIKTSDEKYVVIWVYNTDTSAVKNDIVESLKNISDISSENEAYYLKKYDFTVNEEAIRDLIKEQYPEYIGD